jgi:hypothetical protein
VLVEPEAKATEAMAGMIRTAGKAYSVFDAARLVLANGDRFHVKFSLAPDSGVKLYTVPLDGSLWLSREEALSQFLESASLKEYYLMEEVEMEEPKGNFTSVAVCGMSGEALGPPSHHSYQTNLHKLHRERFNHLPFEEYKRRVRTDNTPEAVEKWKESQKRGTQWVWQKGEVAEGAEPVRLKSRAEMEAHFRKHHAESLVGEVSEATVSGSIPKQLLAPALYIHLRRAVDDARKHLLATAQQLCGGFEHQGLKLFKRRGGKLWVSRVRPRALDSSVVLSDRIAKMVEVIKSKPGLTTKELLETLAPTPASAPAPAPAPAPEAVAAPAEPTTAEEPALEPVGENAPVEGAELSATDDTVTAALEPAEKDAAETATEVPAALPQEPAAEFAPEQVQVLKDLHWLNSEGYVIEYADGVVFPGVTEPPPAKPKPVKAAPAPAPVPAAEATPEAEATENAVADSPPADLQEAPEAALPASSAALTETPSEAPAPVTDIESSDEVDAAAEEPAAEPVEEPAPATETVSTPVDVDATDGSSDPVLLATEAAVASAPEAESPAPESDIESETIPESTDSAPATDDSKETPV